MYEIRARSRRLKRRLLVGGLFLALATGGPWARHALAVVPGAPTNLSATPLNTQARLTWTAVSATPAVTDYVIEYKLSSAGGWSTFADGTSTAVTATVTGLTNGSTYDFRVSAVNSDGTGATSVASSGRVNPTVTQIGASAAGAFSLRLVVASYSHTTITAPAAASNCTNSSTPLVRVRRSSDSGLCDIGFTSAGDLDTTALLAFVTDGGGSPNGSGYVAIWYEQSGTSSDASQVTTFSQPRIVNTGVVETQGGSPVLTFNGSQFLLHGLSFVQAGTMYAVGQSTQNSAYATLAGFTGQNQSMYYNLYSYLTSTTRWGQYSTAEMSSTYSLFNVWRVMSMVAKGAGSGWDLETDGNAPVSVGTSYYGGDGNDRRCIGCSFNGMQIHTGSIAEVILVAGIPTTANKRLIERNQGAYYGVTVVGTVPFAPTSPVAQPGNTTATISFTPPASNGGSPITLYTVTSSPGGLTGTGTASPITVSGLTNGVSYTFTVTATNAYGGTTSAASVAVTPTAPSPPTAPTGPSATPHNSSAALSWTLVSANPVVTDYVVEYKLTSSGSWSTFADGTSAATTATVTGLTNGLSYDFRISAVNANGTGPTSATVSTTPTPDVPTAPTNLSAAPLNGQVALTWTAVSFSPAVTDYVIEYKLSSAGAGSWSTFADGTSTSTTATVTGLTNGSSYDFRVSSVNVDGTGAPCTPVSATPNTGIAQIAASPTLALSLRQVVSTYVHSAITPPAAASNCTNSSTPLVRVRRSSDNLLCDIGPTAAGDLNTTALTAFVTVGGANPTNSGYAAIWYDQSGNNYDATQATTTAQPRIVNSGTVETRNGVAILTFDGTQYMPHALGFSQPGVMYAVAVSTQNSAYATVGAFTAQNQAMYFNLYSHLTSANRWGQYSTAEMSSGYSMFNTWRVMSMVAKGNGSGWDLETDGQTPVSVGTTYYPGDGSDRRCIGCSFGTTQIHSGAIAEIILVTGIPSSATKRVIERNQGNYFGITVAATAPLAPTNPVAAPGDTTATITFTPPASNGGSPITGYTVTSTPGSITGTGSGSPITVSGLTNGVSYTFTVTATNAYGSATSVASNAVTPTAPSLPTAPTGLAATPHNSHVVLAWTSVSSNPAVTDYLIEYKLSSAGSWSTFADGVSATATADVTGLTNGSSYDFRVSAVNSIGTGSPSSTVTATPAPDVPTAPTGLSATPLSTQVQLAWTAVSFSPAVTDYIIEYKLSSAMSWSTFADGTSTAATAVVTGLTNGSSYDFRVSAVNSEGTGPVSSTATATPNSPLGQLGGSAAMALSVRLLVTTYTHTTITAPAAATNCTNSSTPLMRVRRSTDNGLCDIGYTGAGNLDTTALLTFVTNGGASPAASGYVAIWYDQSGASQDATQATAGLQPRIVNAGAVDSKGSVPMVAFNGSQYMGHPLSFVQTGTLYAVAQLTSNSGYSTVGAFTAPNVSMYFNLYGYLTGATTWGQYSSSEQSSTHALYNKYRVLSMVAKGAGSGWDMETDGTTVVSVGSTYYGGDANNRRCIGCSFAGTQMHTGQIGELILVAGIPTSSAKRVVELNQGTYFGIVLAPLPPTSPSAVAGNAGANISFTPTPASENGGSAVTLYTVTSSPGNLVGTGTTSPIIVSWLTNNTAYTFTIKASNSAGAGQISTATASVTPTTTGGKLQYFHAVRRRSDVVISWEFAYEPTEQSFNLFRQQGDGPPTRVNGAPIPGVALDGRAVAHSVVDASPAPGVTYWLERTFLDGTNEAYGPIAVADAVPLAAAPMAPQPVPPAGAPLTGGGGGAGCSVGSGPTDAGAPASLALVAALIALAGATRSRRRDRGSPR
jgi:titin